jgi:hypothetical protein
MFHSSEYAVQAAIQGEGVILGRSALVADDLASGRPSAPCATAPSVLRARGPADDRPTLPLARPGLVETYFPNDVKYKIRAAITDDLGQRSLFLLLLTAAVELTLYSFFKLLKFIVRPN